MKTDNHFPIAGKLFGGFLLLAGLLTVAVLETRAAEPSLAPVTDDERTWLDQHAEKLQLLFNVEFPPVEFASPAGVFVGIGADVIAMVEKRLGVTFSKNPSDDWNHHLAALESGECAIAPTIVRTAERERFTYFTTPYATVPVVIIGTRRFRTGMSLEDFAGKRIAVVSGYATEKYLRDRADSRFEVAAVTNVPEALRAVSFGQVDAYVENLAVAAHYIDQEGIPNLQVIGSTDYVFAFSIGVSRKYPLLYSAIQKALDTIPPSELETVRKRWISLALHKGLSPETVLLLKLTAMFTVLLLLGLAGASYFLKRKLKEKVANLKQSQQTLLERTELLKLATEATQAGIWDYYPATGKNYLSRQWFSMLGYAETDRSISLKEFRAFVHPEDLPVLTKTVEKCLGAEGQDAFEVKCRLRKADGAWCWVLSKGRVAARDENGAPVRLIGLDINIQNIIEAQEKMAQSEAKFRSLFKMAPLPLAEVFRDGRIVEVNDSLKEALGYSIEEVPDMETWWRFAYPDPVYRRQVMETWQKKVTQAMEKGTILVNDERLVTCKNGQVRTMIISASLIGKSFLVSFFDITERKRAEEEREKLQGQLLQSQKLEAIGILAGGVAHDFNNMLGAIIGYTELSMGNMEADDPLRHNLGKILDAARRSANLTRQLLAFARKQTVAPILLDLNESVETMLKMLRRLIGENIELAWMPGTGQCTVKMDPSQIDQILANLCVNARDAISDVGKIKLQTTTVSFDHKSCGSYFDCMPGEYVHLAVSDNGCGMDKETSEHIFEPFFTTKGLGQGTGLGLSTVYGIVKQNEGFITLQSEPGVGTTFNIFLPRHAAASTAEKTESPENIPRGKGETILMVEDDPTLLEMGQMMLRRLGYEVLAANAPSEAIRLVSEGGGEIHLFITDVVMPEMNGRELAERIQQIRPGVRYLFMSGYTADVIVHRGVLDEGVNFIQKPFSIKELGAKIHAVLSEAH
ncbi:MAG: PAS domain-containing protein [Thermodesulfobacteriota bacterium]